MRRTLRPGDVLVFNDTKVIPAQLEGYRGEAAIGCTLHKRVGTRAWAAFVRNARRVRVGDRIDFDAGVAASVVDKAADGSVELHFHGEEPVEILLERAGRMPLPPYIASRRAADAADAEDYQTMFAREDFARLFWFGDEWDLLDQIWKTGFWEWMWQAFAERIAVLENRQAIDALRRQAGAPACRATAGVSAPARRP